MATTKFVDRARMLTSTTGTGTSVALTTAVDGYFTLAEAGLQDGDVVDYIIEQGADFEIQHDQTYSSSGPSLSRGTPAASKVGGTAGTSKINLNGSAQVAIVGLAKSFDVSTFTQKASPTTSDELWGHSAADGARRRIPISGILDLVPTSGVLLLNSGTVSNAANLDIVLPNTSLYVGYSIVLASLVPESDGANLYMRTSENSGSSFSEGSSDYRWAILIAVDNNVAVQRNSTATGSSVIELMDTIGNNGEENASCVIDIHNPSGTRACLVNFRASRLDNVGLFRAHYGGGARTTVTSGINAVRFYMSTGNISSAVWALYGMRS